MELKTCFACHKKIDFDSNICPYCRTSQGFLTKSFIIIVIIVSSLVFLRIFGILFDCRQYLFPTEKTKKSLRPTDLNICVSANAVVRELLKSPATAKFPYYGDGCTTKNLGNNLWQASSFVDSENSFGAMLRTNFTVILEYKGTSDNFGFKYFRNDDTGESFGTYPVFSAQPVIKRIEADQKKPNSSMITGIVGGDNPAAIIGEKVYTEGNNVGNLKIVKIGKDYVDFVDDKGNRLRKLLSK